MPGRRLSNSEKNLLDFWQQPPSDFSQTLLKAITIDGPPKLRGIEKLRIEFDYPITAICGRNGVGKSTILSLAALSAKRPKDWRVAPWPTSPRRKQSSLMNYHWSDFFFRHHSAPSYTDFKVRFDYSIAGNEIEIERLRTEKYRWRTNPDYGRSKQPRFPKRSIEFVSLSRILPPSELRDARNAFGTKKESSTESLSEDILENLSWILDRPYTTVDVHETNKVRLARCNAGADYSGFDMGAGENAAIAILSALGRLPNAGLLLIEEIEHGFHPEAQKRLINALTKIVKKTKQQIIFTTHSEHIIDALPREARVLVNKVNDDHKVLQSPTTRLAMSNMIGTTQEEATIYVEDDFAETLVSNCLPLALRSRVRIVAIGDASKVASQMGAHIRGGYLGQARCIFDGDCQGAEINKWMNREDLKGTPKKYYSQLPGDDLPPERWIVRELEKQPYIGKFATQIGSNESDTLHKVKQVQNLPDHHGIPYQLSKSLNLPERDITYAMITALALEHPALEEIRCTVKEMLK
ncbi:MAG: ATP-binding protein [Bacteroidetes bacterium SB0662_bin_6]|nr:ATP-binding protein [Bacteroidetes bacterium SB0668_bin_1]MYE03894.1 ATP-binding protein [Bacteroidetes bacterium SB0662_bin_6]